MGASGSETFDERAHRLRVESKPLMSHLDRFRLRRLHELERFQALQEQAEIWEAKREVLDGRKTVGAHDHVHGRWRSG